MKNIFKYGSYIWTVSGAGWIVIGVVTHVPEAYIAGVACSAMAGLWLICAETQ
jgi:hypothetical protein